jgi:hypothetical protein
MSLKSRMTRYHIIQEGVDAFRRKHPAIHFQILCEVSRRKPVIASIYR